MCLVGTVSVHLKIKSHKKGVEFNIHTLNSVPVNFVLNYDIF